MKIVIDLECNSLRNPTKIWCIVCKDIDTGDYHVFRQVHEDSSGFLAFSKKVDLWIGHNWLGYDFPILNKLVGFSRDNIADKSLDTLILSRLIDYPRPKHSIEDYGVEFGLEKIEFNDWTHWSQEMEDYCVRDVDICHRVYSKYLKYCSSPEHRRSISLEHRFQLVVNSLHDNGFGFNTERAENLLVRVKRELATLDKDILEQFPPKLGLIREITPKVTQHGTLNRADFRWCKGGDVSEFNGGPFCRCERRDFNPASHKQVLGVLHSAGWRPVDKTQTHIDTERELTQLRRKRRDTEVDLAIKVCETKILGLQKSGWKINETNLATLPASAPAPARTLAKRILYESRRRTLTEWLGLVQDDGRIHGEFAGIGAWTHRMAHQKPNTANIPNDLKEDGSKKLLGKELRSLWRAPSNRLLVGVDAEGIQLRIFAHYIDDPEFTDALVRGKKADKTDPHSLNQRVLGSVCKSRQAAKRFVYALLLGGGIGKLGFILGCEREEAQEALDRLLQRYTGFEKLKKEVIPKDAKRGYFIGLDGRKVRIPGETASERNHLCMSGYLQNGEAIVMKAATLKWHHLLKEDSSLLVDMVHDEWQTETPNDMAVALRVAEIQSQSLAMVGEELGLKCPLAGSYFNDDNKDYTIGVNWYQTH